MSVILDRLIELLRPATIFHSVSSNIQDLNIMNATASTAFVIAHHVKRLASSPSLHSSC
jgi:hypothetical protein